jgi:hypothetical protein
MALSPENDPVEQTRGQLSKNEVEMNDLKMSNEGTASTQAATHLDTTMATSASEMPATSTPTAEAEPIQNPTAEPPSATPPSKDGLSPNAPSAETSTATTIAPQLARQESVAIGPSTEAPPASAIPVLDAANPVCSITLLLTSGARHPYKLDEKYLTKRNVAVPGVTESGKKDPFSISVYTLKELILREWREEWEAPPSSPSSIRLIHFGRLLDDKAPLKGECVLYTAPCVCRGICLDVIANCRFLRMSI